MSGERLGGRERHAGVGIADDVAAEWEVLHAISSRWVFFSVPLCHQVGLADGVHRVRLDHGTTSGKRIITVDDKEVHF